MKRNVIDSKAALKDLHALARGTLVVVCVFCGVLTTTREPTRIPDKCMHGNVRWNQWFIELFHITDIYIFYFFRDSPQPLQEFRAFELV